MWHLFIEPCLGNPFCKTRKIILALVSSLCRRPGRKMQSLGDVYMTCGKGKGKNETFIESPGWAKNCVMLFPLRLIKSWQCTYKVLFPFLRSRKTEDKRGYVKCLSKYAGRSEVRLWSVRFRSSHHTHTTHWPLCLPTPERHLCKRWSTSSGGLDCIMSKVEL